MAKFYNQLKPLRQDALHLWGTDLEEGSSQDRKMRRILDRQSCQQPTFERATDQTRDDT